MESAQFRLNRHITHQSIKKDDRKKYCIVDIQMWCDHLRQLVAKKASQGRRSGYGDNFASRGVFFITSITSSSWKPMMLVVPDGFIFPTVVQRGLSWVRTKISQKRAANWTGDQHGNDNRPDGGLRDEPEYQEAFEASEHAPYGEDTMRPLYTMVATGAASPCPTASLWLIFQNFNTAHMSGFSNISL